MVRGARLGAHAFGAAIGIGLVACNAIIGEKDIFFAPDDAGGSDVASGSDGTTTDARDDGSIGVDSGPCGDVMTSATSCGRCGHDCLGGACLAGKCQPVALKSGISPRSVAVDANHVYWVESNAARIGQMDKDGTNAIDLALGGPKNAYPVGLAVDDANAFWGGIDDFVLRCKIGGCANTPATVSTTAASFTDVVVDATTLFWIEAPSNSRVVFLAKTTTNGAGGSLLFGAPVGASLGRLAQDTASVYVSSDDKTVRRVAKANGATNVVGKATGATFAIAVDDANVYFSDGDDPATIDVVSKTAVNVNATPLVAGQHHPFAIAIDAVSIYWVNAYVGLGAADGTVMTCAFSACSAPTILADKQHDPIAIAVDATAIYWASFDAGNNGGAIMKLAKP